MMDVIVISLVTASISFTFTEMKLFLPLREWARKRNAFLGEFLSCGYCLGHWIALGLTVLYRPKLFTAWWPADYFFTVLVIAWLAAFQWALICWLMQKAGK